MDSRISKRDQVPILEQALPLCELRRWAPVFLQRHMLLDVCGDMGWKWSREEILFRRGSGHSHLQGTQAHERALTVTVQGAECFFTAYFTSINQGLWTRSLLCQCREFS